ncbi:rod shape-determining protein MreC [Larkinella arboricola]|uniref:Cell shape-determining protein MreC n=1 Tax=Larkinella arboricola TaxID=643671 RepID=A0A327X0Q1_LARAB|nr:rod shape-determining protein MreC [Larkinella arboricola]RAJ97864.1 rod shape-determining protein MreC [Larkinella arboricola]
MFELVQFIIKSRNIILFVLLEVLSFYFIINNNNYWSIRYFNTSNYYVAKVLDWSNKAKQYAQLRQVNNDLAEENRRLNALVTQLQQLKPSAPTSYKTDSIFATRFKYTVARVINNTTQHPNNYITLDKGTADGIRPGMGVISPTGVVGKVKSCSEHLCIVTSILHSNYMISSKLVKAGVIGSAKWDGINPSRMKMLDISRNTKMYRGDSVVTSEYNSTFPSGILVGRVIGVRETPSQTFHDVTLSIGTDFNNLSFVYIVENKLQGEQEKLEQTTEPEKK